MSQNIDLVQAAKLLYEKDRFTIICHASPDGDTLGGAYALCGALQKMQKRAKVVTPEAASMRFDYLKEAVSPDEDFGEEYVVTIDTADAALLGDMEEKYKTSVDLCIDHHVSNTGYAELLLLDSSAAAACEIVFELIKKLSALHGQDLINSDIAACLYTGISTDTGCFRFANTTAKSHRRTAELMDYGFDSEALNYLLFEMRTKERLLIEKQALESVEFYFGGKCAIITLTKEMLEATDDEDVNAISALPKQIYGAELGVTFKEKGGGVWKISLRSKGNIDSQKICAVFGGGGHMRAAGCRVKGTLEENKEKLLKEIEKYM
ncbi:MAG: bifunctional oligoribonuclease/PAP phosphatase NrnA [Oscillospiraceae bacterium]|nr:bifunctional oligoribonuclease/PAP phosphatase NrnA [Oscillospiraceae bacterium]